MLCPFCKKEIQGNVTKCEHCGKYMPNKLIVALKNPRTGEIKEIKVGWSWVLLFFSWTLVPLFLRKLHTWVGIMLTFFVVSIIAQIFMEEVAFVVTSLISFGLHAYLSAKGNELTAKNYLNMGWNFVDPDSDHVKAAKEKWGITV